jgi:hypothetical protein
VVMHPLACWLMIRGSLITISWPFDVCVVESGCCIGTCDCVSWYHLTWRCTALLAEKQEVCSIYCNTFLMEVFSCC